VLHIQDLEFGPLTPALAYLVSVLGGYLGFGCLGRARASGGAAATGWLALAAAAIGTTGLWAAQALAMLGFAVPGRDLRYSVAVTTLSLATAIGVTGAALATAGLASAGLSPARPARTALTQAPRGRRERPDGHRVSWRGVLLAGIVTGTGTVSMDDIGLAAVQVRASFA
jgi:NO-binding membrane sensor protein with MHYT domain